jgi:integrase
MRLADFPITLFRRAGSPFWYARFTPKGGTQIKVGLATADVDAAIRKAVEAYLEAGIRIKTGLNSTARPFGKIADDYLKAHPDDAGEVVRYFKAFWSEKPIDAIDDTEYQKFLHWRRSYWTSGPGKTVAFIDYMRGGKSLRRPVARKVPSASRLRNEAIILHRVFRHARSTGWLARLPEFQLPKAVDNRRSTFTAEQFQKVEAAARLRMEAPGLSLHVRADRARLWAYVVVMTFSGMRVTEGKNLRWKDIALWSPDENVPLGQRDVEFYCCGKARKRHFAPHKDVIPALDLLYDLDKPRPDDRVFRPKSFRKSLSALLDECGLLRDDNDMFRGAGSFRHFYGTQQKLNGVDVYELAKLMGTSVQMIERFYGHIQSRQLKNRARPDWVTGEPVAS